MNIGKKLFELRKSRNLTQDDVAEKLEVTRQTVSKWETNQSTPDFDKIVPLCELYGITPNELLTEEKQEQETDKNEGNEEFNWNEAKKHLFTRGKEDEDNYENMTRGKIKQKSAEVVSSSILIFFIAVAFAGIGTVVLMWNPVVVGCTFLVLVGWGVTRIVRHYMSIPKYEKTEEKVLDQINGIIGCICVALYFIISFTTMAWHITWVIFIIEGLITLIVKLIFTLKGDETNEE